MPLRKKLILLTESIDEQMKITRLLNSINSKIMNKKNIGDGIQLSFEEGEMIQNIVVSENTQTEARVTFPTLGDLLRDALKKDQETK